MLLSEIIVLFWGSYRIHKHTLGDSKRQGFLTSRQVMRFITVTQYTLPNGMTTTSQQTTMTLFPIPMSTSRHLYYHTSCMNPIRCFFQYQITVPDTGEIEIDERFGFQPYFHKMWNNFNISLCMCTAVHTNRHEQFLSRTHHFWILQPHLQPWSRCHTNLQQHTHT